MAAPEVVVDSAALVAQVLVQLAVVVQLPLLAQPQVLVLLPKVVVVEARLPVLAQLEVEVPLPLELLLSRQSFSAAMARSTP